MTKNKVISEISLVFVLANISLLPTNILFYKKALDPTIATDTNREMK